MFENSDYHVATPDSVQSKVGAGLNQAGQHYKWPDNPVYLSFNARYMPSSHFNNALIFLPMTCGFLSDAFTMAGQDDLAGNALSVTQSLMPLFEAVSQVAGLL